MAREARDVQDADAAMAELLTGEDESIPAAVSERLVLGDEHPLKVWREYRGYTQELLGVEAELTGL